MEMKSYSVRIGAASFITCIRLIERESASSASLNQIRTNCIPASGQTQNTLYVRAFRRVGVRFTSWSTSRPTHANRAVIGALSPRVRPHFANGAKVQPKGEEI